MRLAGLCLLTLLSACSGGNNQVGAPLPSPTGGPASPPSACPLDTAWQILPGDGADNIPPSRPLRILLRNPLTDEQLTARSGAIRLDDEKGNGVAISSRLTDAGCKIEARPKEMLRGDSEYRLRVDMAALIGEAANGEVTHRFRTMDTKFLGASFFNSEIPAIDRLTRYDLLGVLRFGGRWVTELALPERNPDVAVPNSYLQALHRFCEFAVARQQQSWIQIPVFLPDDGLQRALDYLQQREDGCNLLLFAIGNEVDRMDSDEERYAKKFDWPDYLAALRRIVPRLRERFPDAPIAALDLSSFEEYDDYRAIADWVAPLCASNDPVIDEVDFLSIHFYPYTGAQKLWDMLGMGRQFADNLRQLPADCPPLLLGEYNTTYQWRPASTYPGSGGDAFIPLLTLPEVLHQRNTIGLLHWSLIEGDTSTLGLFQPPALTPRPVYPGYLLLKAITNTAPVATRRSPPDLAVSAFSRGETLHLYLGNYRPIFRHGIDIGGDDAAISIDYPDIAIAALPPLPPFSLTYLRFEDGTVVSRQRISYRDQNIDTVAAADTALHCIPVADFSEPNIAGVDFIRPDFNQNLKIDTAGTPVPVPLTDGATLEEMDGLIEVRCDASPQYCGISLPLVADTTTQRSVDWSEAVQTASFRLTVSNPGIRALSLRAQLASTHPATHEDIEQAFTSRFFVAAGQTTEVVLPWRLFQPPAANDATLPAALAKLAALRLLLSAPRQGDSVQLRRVEICDQTTTSE